MSVGGSGSSQDLPQFKKFESENEIEEKKRKRQEEWEKVRTADQPLEAPEEEYDHRSLYERLQEQKDKKQAEYEEQFKAKNQVRGLDNEEAEFLDYVSERTQELEKQRELEDYQVIREYKNSLVSKVSEPSSSVQSSKPGTSRQTSNRKSQSAMLMGAVKRKGSATENEATDEKKTKVSSPEKTSGDQPEASSTDSQDINTPSAVAQIVGVLPGLGAYSESSDSDSNSSESDIDVSTFKQQIKAVMCSQSNTSNR